MTPALVYKIDYSSPWKFTRAFQYLQMTIAILSNIHDNPLLVGEQLRNYFKRHGDSAYHVLHRSKDSIALDTFRTLDELVDPQLRFRFSGVTALTSSSCCFPGILAAWTDVLNVDSLMPPSHIYWHSDSDLLISGHFTSYVQSGYIGLADPRATRMGTWWMYHAAAVRDPRLARLMKFMEASSPEELRLARIEGIFMPYSDWSGMMAILSDIFPLDSFCSPESCCWPIEEVAIPSILSKLYPSSRFSRNTVRVSVDGSRTTNLISVDAIDALRGQLSDGECAAMKWFSPSPDDPARVLANILEAQSI